MIAALECDIFGGTQLMKQLGLLLLLLAAPVWAQEKNTEHTLKLAAGQASPSATINDMAWFAGRWTGDGMGGQNEETWGPPENGRMIGTFKHSQNGKPVFYEFMTFFEHEGSLVLRLKHFNPDLTGWEEKDKFVEFKFVAKKDGAMYFNGLTFMPDGPNGSKDAAKIYLALRNKDGAVNEVVFHLKRTPPHAANAAKVADAKNKPGQ
jgi:hypothetical protein